MARVYLKDNDRIWAECYLRYDAKSNCLYLEQIEGDAYFDGMDLSFDEEDKPYIGE